MLSVIIPAHDEEGNIEKTVSKVLEELKGLDFEILVVDDNSSDDTGKIAGRLSKRFKRVRVLHRKGDNGFGRAIKDGLLSAKGDILIPLMGDLSDDPADIRKMLAKMDEGYDIVLGSRFIPGSTIEGYPKVKLYFGNRVFNNVFRIMYFSKFRDISNAFKAYRKEVIGSVDIESKGFSITAEIFLKAIVKGFRVGEVPVGWYGRKSGAPKMNFMKVSLDYGKVLLAMWPKYVWGKLNGKI